MKALLKSNKNLLFVTLIAILAISCETSSSNFVKNVETGGALGTSYSIIFFSTTQTNLKMEIDSVFEVINRSLSTYIPTSDISRINRGDTLVEVDALFRDVFTISKQVYEETNGYFDPTVGALVNAWGFGPGKAIVMDSIRIDSLMKFVGLDKVDLNADNRISKNDARVYLDFNAVAKGYAIDQLANLMDSQRIENYLIEVGGEIVAKGTHKIKQKPWVVGIDDPLMEEGRRLKRTLTLEDKAMASSGNYRKFRVDSITGKKYVHTIDPKTGYTRNGNILATSVIASTCAEADAFATAFMAMSLEKSKELINSRKDLDVYIIYLTEENTISEYMTEGFKKRIIL